VYDIDMMSERYIYTSQYSLLFGFWDQKTNLKLDNKEQWQ